MGDCLAVRAETDKYVFVPHGQNSEENPHINVSLMLRIFLSSCHQIKHKK